MNRPLIYQLAAMAGLPLGILAPYRTYLETSQAHFQFGKCIGLPHRTRTSIPQGCPFSMVMIALLTLPWIHLMQHATALPRVLADDLLFTAIGEDCDAVLAHAFRLTADFMDRAGARLALPTKDKLGKCFVCAADTATRDRIRWYTWGSDKVSLPVLNTFRDLGSHMNVSCRVDGATLSARITSALTSLGRLRHMPIPRAHKVTAVLTHILPKALYGAEAVSYTHLTLPTKA